MAKPLQAPFQIAGIEIAAGERRIVDLPLSLLSNHSPLTLPVEIVHGSLPGPRMFICAGVHGDELNGVEIVRRLLSLPLLRKLRGTLLAVPVVNVMGFIGRTRYLPDRRDLNRSFPGSPGGSMAAQLAHVFMTEVVARCTHGIDLHTGALHRTNLPQVRASLSGAEVRRLANAFGAPVVVDSPLREGSLRDAAAATGIPVLLYEGGEALRFDEVAIRAGVRGIVRVLRAIGMLPAAGRAGSRVEPVMARGSSWTRAPAGGIARITSRLGTKVEKDSRLGLIADPFGQTEFPVTAHIGGVVIGRTTLPVVNQGDALVHIARVEDAEQAAETVDIFHEELEDSVPEGDLEPR